NDGVAVRADRDSRALVCRADVSRAHQLRALLRPGGPDTNEDPRRALVGVVEHASDDGGISIRAQLNTVSLTGGADAAPADDARSLLAPGGSGACEDPGRTLSVVARSADDGGISVGAHRHRAAETDRAILHRPRADAVGGYELGALLGPGRAGSRE